MSFCLLGQPCCRCNRFHTPSFEVWSQKILVWRAIWPFPLPPLKCALATRPFFCIQRSQDHHEIRYVGPIPFLALPSCQKRIETPLCFARSRSSGQWTSRGLQQKPKGVEVCTGSKLKPEPGPYPRLSDPTRPDPSGTVKFRARTRPEIPPNE